MPSFAYRGVSTTGRSVSGVVEADSAKSARAQLREKGIFASEVRTGEAATAKHGPAFRFRRGVSVRELSRTLRQLATLLAAGMPLVDAIGSIAGRQGSPAMRSALAAVREEITAGTSFERAIAKQPGVFPGIYIGMIRAGETSGALESVLTRIADHAEASARLQAQFRSAMTYPTVMMLVGGGIVTFLLAYVVPQVTRVFTESGQTLPFPTRALMVLGSFIASYGLPVALSAAAALLGLRRYASTAAGGRRVERLLFAAPWLGTVLRNVTMARFAHSMATMLSGGMTLVDALEVSRSVTGSRLVADAIREAKESVSRGEPLAVTLHKSARFNPMVVDMIGVGEKSGDIEGMLRRAADALDEEVRFNVETMAGLLEPVMILAMAGVVLFVVLAIMLPVFEMNQLVR